MALLAQSHESMALKAQLYLFASPLDNGEATRVKDHVAPMVLNTLRDLRHFFVEDVRSTRRYFASLNCFESIDALCFHDIGKHASRDVPLAVLRDLQQEGQAAGLLSMAGLPVVADPGAALVAHCQQHNIKVRPLGVACAPLAALMGSGFSGQRFAFRGYLPIEEKACKAALRELLQKCQKETQIFIEAPHRNSLLFERLLAHAPAEQLLCIASLLDAPESVLKTQHLKAWRKERPLLQRKPTTFVLGKYAAFSLDL